MEAAYAALVKEMASSSLNPSASCAPPEQSKRIHVPPSQKLYLRPSSQPRAASIGETLASERSGFLRSLVDLRLQLEADRVAAVQAVTERDELRAR